ncbi:MAG: serine/threonine protein kinase [Myxococcaceae bacterium]|nr:serine/threonine protein kinase [Myxococcaceae bacterium]
MSDDEKKKDPALEQTLTDSLSSTLASIKAPTLQDPVIGANVEGYVVKSRLGVGGMGIVYEGHHEVIGKRAAIKVLRPEYAENPEQLQRLVSEARAVNQVGHRGIIDVFAYGQLPDGRQCIVMEYLDGQPLEDVLTGLKKQQQLMPLTEVLEILDEVLSALNAAHEAGVVHRDLKPSNIFMVRQRDARFVKLLDFGIAKLGALGGSTPVSRASMIAGTPTYMAPEQARGAGAAPTMDLYSVGVIAFEMLTNVPPFDSESVMGMLMAHAEAVPKKPSQLRSEVPDAVDELVLRLLAKQPADRFRTAEHCRAEVVRLKAHLKDPTAPRTLQDEAYEPSVQSEILAVSQVVPDPQKNKATLIQLEAPAPAPAAKKKPAAPPAAALANETLVLPKREAVAAPPGTSQLIAPQRSRLPVFVLAVVTGGLFVAAGFVLRGSGEPPPPPPKPVVVAEAPKPKPAPPPPPPEPVKAPEPPPPEPEPLPPPVVEAPEPVPPPKPKPEPVVARVAPPPPPPPKAAIQGAGLLGRVKKLEARIDKAHQGGADVALYLKQVQRIRQKLEAGPLSQDDRTRVEVALDSLEKSSDY